MENEFGEPWEQIEYMSDPTDRASFSLFAFKDGHKVSHLGDFWDNCPELSPELRESIGKRIVACVNFLAEVPTEFLDQCQSGHFADLLADHDAKKLAVHAAIENAIDPLRHIQLPGDK